MRLSLTTFGEFPEYQANSDAFWTNTYTNASGNALSYRSFNSRNTSSSGSGRILAIRVRVQAGRSGGT